MSRTFDVERLPRDNFGFRYAWIAFSPLFRGRTVSSRNNGSRCQLMSRGNHSSADELSVFFFPFRPCYFEKQRTAEEKKDTGEKEKRGRKREEEEKQRRGGKKNRRVNCFPAANGRQLKLKILDYLHRAFTHTRARLYAWNEKQMLRVDRLDLVTTDSSQKSRNRYIREREGDGRRKS